MGARYIVTLSEEERHALETLIRRGKPSARKVKRAQILLAAERGETEAKIASTLSVGTSTVHRTKSRLVEQGLQAALSEEPRTGAQRKLSGCEEAVLIAVACSAPPSGRARWTLDLLADEVVRRTEHETLSRETIRRRLAENQLKPWRQKMWCIPKVDAEYVARMEDVLDLYAEPGDAKRPVVCFDETPVQLVGEVRQPRAAKPGTLARIDYEYCRNGTANLFVFLDAHAAWRHVKVTERRTALDFAQCMYELAMEHYREADTIRVVLDNLSAHKPAALYEAYEPALARELLRRLEFHFVPKHASWLNMVEIEIGVLVSQCLDRRIPDRDTLVREIASWERQRNDSGAQIKWMFDVTRAREKLGRSYPQNVFSQPAKAA